MNAVLNGAVVCGKPTRRGVCQIKLRGGKCPVHARGRKQVIAERNRKAHANRVANHPDEWKAHQARAGLHNWRNATELARQWRLAHPSVHEKHVIELLIEHVALDAHWDREYVIDGDPRAIDIVFPQRKVAIEVCDHGRPTAAKVEWLERLGWNVHVYDANADSDAADRLLLAFLSSVGLLDSSV